MLSTGRHASSSCGRPCMVGPGWGWLAAEMSLSPAQECPAGGFERTWWGRGMDTLSYSTPALGARAWHVASAQERLESPHPLQALGKGHIAFQ